MCGQSAYVGGECSSKVSLHNVIAVVGRWMSDLTMFAERKKDLLSLTCEHLVKMCLVLRYAS
jgi:hypothetical protein